MADLAQPGAFSVASPSDIEQTARRLAAIREHFLATGSAGAPALRTLIRDSWRRCQALDVDAARELAAFSASSDGLLTQLRAVNQPLLRAALPVLDRLSQKLGDVGYVVALSDAQGSLLEILGNGERRRQLARKGLLPGSNWSEAAAGTNAIGTALATGRVVQLLAAEHYCAGWQDVTCTAAPILHPETGAVAGVLDITGDYRLIRPFLSGMLAVAALEVRQQLASEARPAALFSGVTLPAPPPDDELARRADAAERLAAAAGSISASLDLTITLETVVAQACQVLDLPCAAACLFDEAEGALSSSWRSPVAGDVVPRALAALLQLPEVAAWCGYGAPTMFDAPDQMPAEIATLVAPAGLRALVLLPLITARGAIGALVAGRLSARPWQLDDLRLGMALAAHAATALENASMVADLRRYARHSEALNALASCLSTLLDPNRHLDLVLAQIAQVTDLDAGLMLLSDHAEGGLAVVAGHGVPPEQPAAGSASLRESLIELVAPVARTGETLLLCRQRETGPAAVLLAASGFCDLVAVPLALNTVNIGVLVVGSRGHRSVTREDLTLFTTIGQQIGLALSNARLRRAASETEALREADRLKSQFLAAVSHDLRSPLTAIRASVEGLIERQELAIGDPDGLLQNISRQAGRLSRFVDQLLDLSCIEAGRLAIDREWIELPALLADLLASFRQRFPGCVVEQAVSPDLPPHYLDPALCAQVFWNLLENAQKYGPPAGPLRVEAFCTGDQVLISVADRGPGVPATERTKIFDHFYRGERDRRTHVSGSGLGLAICRGVVSAHEGRIWVDERPGGGSIFRVALPLAAPDPAEPPL